VTQEEYSALQVLRRRCYAHEIGTAVAKMPLAVRKASALGATLAQALCHMGYVDKRYERKYDRYSYIITPSGERFLERAGYATTVVKTPLSIPR
jgi:hypothetical protein